MIQLVSKIISNPSSVGNVFSIYGPMGTGKTTIIKNGLSKLLGLPFIFISLGGATDSSFLDGHSYTYEGSIPGRIVEALKTTKCMNPIFYFDELDKVSETSRGVEIINLLIHLTDPSQNSHYNDKYYGDIPFDLSKALFVFSFNDLKRVNPILRDRMNLIKVDGFTFEDKINIARDFLLPSIFNEYSINLNEIIFNEEIIKYIINKNQSSLSTEKEEGVRGIKKRLEIVISNLNVIKIAFMNNKYIENEEENNQTSVNNSTKSKSSQLKKRLRKKHKKQLNENNISQDKIQIDLESIKKILPNLKDKLSSNNNLKLEEILKTIKIPINVSQEIVDLFLFNNINENSPPMFMYT